MRRSRARAGIPRRFPAPGPSPWRQGVRLPRRSYRRTCATPSAARSLRDRSLPLRPGSATSSLLLHHALREVRERLVRLRLLLAGKIDAVAGEEGARLGRDLERLAGGAASRELEHAGPVRVEPRLADERAPELGRRETRLPD